MKFKYARIQGRENSYSTGSPRGIFAMCWKLIYEGKMKEEDELVFREVDDWFKENLPEPESCQKNEAVITYFKVETTKEMIEKLETVLLILEKMQKPYDLLYTNFVGEIVYEDKWQVAVRVKKSEEDRR